MNIEINQENAADQAAVFALNQQAFGQDAEALLVESLRGDPAFIPELSLVAKSDHQVLGYLLFTKVLIQNEPMPATESLALAPVAVLPQWQGQGIGSQLITSGLELARQLGYGSVIVLGHAGYYPRFGFREAAHWQIQCPFPVPSANFMAMELQAGALKGISGIVRYPAPFAMV